MYMWNTSVTSPSKTYMSPEMWGKIGFPINQTDNLKVKMEKSGVKEGTYKETKILILISSSPFTPEWAKY